MKRKKERKRNKKWGEEIYMKEIDSRWKWRRKLVINYSVVLPYFLPFFFFFERNSERGENDYSTTDSE